MSLSMIAPQRIDTETVLSVEGLSHRYDDHVAVDDLSFEVARGEFVALLGSNGAGKTTTLEILQGLRSATFGEVSVLGHDVSDPNWRSKVGVMLQDDALAGDLTAAESVQLFGRLSGREDSVADCLTMVGLADKTQTLIRKLSGGERRRVEFAIAAWGAPELIFLDEPTTGLDAAGRAELWDVVDGLAQRGTTFVLTTHYLEEVERFADRIVILHKGQMVASGTLDELTSRQQSTISCSQGGDTHGLPLEHERRGDGFVVRSDEVPSDLSRMLNWAESERVDLGRLEVRPASLENVFLSLTGSEIRV